MSYHTEPKARANASASAGVAFPVFTLAFAVLFVLKIAGEAGASWGLANLSWWWVVSPLFIGFGLFLCWLAIIAVVILVIAWADSK